MVKEGREISRLLPYRGTVRSPRSVKFTGLAGITGGLGRGDTGTVGVTRAQACFILRDSSG